MSFQDLFLPELQTRSTSCWDSPLSSKRFKAGYKVFSSCNPRLISSLKLGRWELPLRPLSRLFTKAIVFLQGETDTLSGQLTHKLGLHILPPRFRSIPGGQPFPEVTGSRAAGTDYSVLSTISRLFSEIILFDNSLAPSISKPV